VQVQKCVSAPNSLQAEPKTKDRHHLKQNLQFFTLKFEKVFQLKQKMLLRVI